MVTDIPPGWGKDCGRETKGANAMPPSREPPSRPLRLGTRKRAYFIMMGICLLLFVLSWAVIWRYSILAAVVMSAVALCIPPFAAIVANSGWANRQ